LYWFLDRLKRKMKVKTMEVKTIKSTKAPNPVGAYPHAKQVGSFLFLSGIGPRKVGSDIIPGVTLNKQKNIIAYDIAEQTHSVFNNVIAVLKDANASLEQLVDVTVFLTNMKADFAEFNEIYAQYFPNNKPCRTTVEVNSLPTPIAVEFKCIAVLT